MRTTWQVPQLTSDRVLQQLLRDVMAMFAAIKATLIREYKPT